MKLIITDSNYFMLPNIGYTVSKISKMRASELVPTYTILSQQQIGAECYASIEICYSNPPGFPVKRLGLQINEGDELAFANDDETTIPALEDKLYESAFIYSDPSNAFIPYQLGQGIRKYTFNNRNGSETPYILVIPKPDLEWQKEAVNLFSTTSFNTAENGLAFLKKAIQILDAIILIPATYSICYLISLNTDRIVRWISSVCPPHIEVLHERIYD